MATISWNKCTGSSTTKDQTTDGLVGHLGDGDQMIAGSLTTMGPDALWGQPGEMLLECLAWTMVPDRGWAGDS